MIWSLARLAVAFTLICAAAFGTVILVNSGDTKAATTFSYNVADTGGKGAGIGWGALPVFFHGIQDSTQAMHKMACDKDPKAANCQEGK